MRGTQTRLKIPQELMNASLKFRAASPNWLYLITKENKESEDREDSKQPGVRGSSELLSLIKGENVNLIGEDGKL